MLVYFPIVKIHIGTSTQLATQLQMGKLLKVRKRKRAAQMLQWQRIQAKKMSKLSNRPEETLTRKRVSRLSTQTKILEAARPWTNSNMVRVHHSSCNQIMYSYSHPKWCLNTLSCPQTMHKWRKRRKREALQRLRKRINQLNLRNNSNEMKPGAIQPKSRIRSE